MSVYAVIETGGKQYKVSEGDVLKIERLSADAGSTITFDKVLALGGDNGLTVSPGAAVTAEIIEHFRGPKLVAYKKKRRKGYERKVGHRQELTKVKITALA